MVYDFEDKSDPPDLHEFKSKLATHVFKTALFQNEPMLSVNMLKLPLIMPDSMVGRKINSDYMKDSLLDETIKHSTESLHELGKLSTD